MESTERSSNKLVGVDFYGSLRADGRRIRALCGVGTLTCRLQEVALPPQFVLRAPARRFARTRGSDYLVRVTTEVGPSAEAEQKHSRTNEGAQGQWISADSVVGRQLRVERRLVCCCNKTRRRWRWRGCARRRRGHCGRGRGRGSRRRCRSGRSRLNRRRDNGRGNNGCPHGSRCGCGRWCGSRCWVWGGFGGRRGCGGRARRHRGGR